MKEIKLESKSFLKGIEYFKGEEGKLLYSSIKRWNKMLKSLIKLDRLDSAFQIEDSVDYSFLENALVTLNIDEN